MANFPAMTKAIVKPPTPDRFIAIRLPKDATNYLWELQRSTNHWRTWDVLRRNMAGLQNTNADILRTNGHLLPLEEFRLHRQGPTYQLIP